MSGQSWDVSDTCRQHWTSLTNRNADHWSPIVSVKRSCLHHYSPSLSLPCMLMIPLALDIMPRAFNWKVFQNDVKLAMGTSFHLCPSYIHLLCVQLMNNVSTYYIHISKLMVPWIWNKLLSHFLGKHLLPV